MSHAPAFRTLPDLVREHAQARPEAPALRGSGPALSYGELDALMDRVAAALQRDAGSLSDSGNTLRNIVVGLFLIALLFAMLRSCDGDDCQDYRDNFGESSAEYQQCKRNSSGSGVRTGSGGGSYGGYNSGGGGHK